jgi:hypothetical protein
MEHTLDYKNPPRYQTYQKRHQDRFGDSAMISEEEFKSLSKKPCHYCGVAGPNGIDRTDSQKGYTDANCVPACKHCNYVKGNLSMFDFTAWVNRFVEYQNKINTDLANEYSDSM